MSFLKKPPTRPKNTEPRKIWLDIDGVDVPVVIQENPRSRRLTLRIMPGGEELRVSVPLKTPYREINAFLYKNRNWAAARPSRMPKVQRLKEGVEIKIRGVPHRIIHAGKGRGLSKVVECEGGFQLHVHGDPRHLPRRVVDFLKKQAREQLSKSVGFHAANLGVKPKSVTLRDTKTRWGSCSSNGALSFSWRIILAPPDILDYLAAHEVAHLREMNHSSRFWQLVQQTCPHTRASKAWLKAHGAELHALVTQAV